MSVKTTLQSTLLVVGLSTTGQAAQWIMYDPPHRRCVTASVTPDEVIAQLRARYRITPHVEDVTDASGKVTEVFITIRTQNSGGFYYAMFRYQEDCERVREEDIATRPDKYN